MTLAKTGAGTPEPHCDTCGVEITTGFMAFFCPHAEQCEFWPRDSDAETQLLTWRHWAAEARQQVSRVNKQRAELTEQLAQRDATIARLSQEADGLARDAARWRTCAAVGFPVRNQTPHDSSHLWTIDGLYFGPTPPAVVDAYIAGDAAIEGAGEPKFCAICGMTKVCGPGCLP